MRLLLDTHALLWWFLGDAHLSPAAADAVSAADGQVYVSAASAWEITTKVRLGKLPRAEGLAADLEPMVAGEGFLPLAITLRHGRLAGNLPGVHKDPFDRMLIAQAIYEDLVLVSNERIFDGYGAPRLW